MHYVDESATFLRMALNYPFAMFFYSHGIWATFFIDPTSAPGRCKACRICAFPAKSNPGGLISVRATCKFSPHRAALDGGGAQCSDIAVRRPQIVWLADLFTSTNWSATHVNVQTVREMRGKTLHQAGKQLLIQVTRVSAFYWLFRKIRRAPRLESAFLGIAPLKTPTVRV